MSSVPLHPVIVHIPIALAALVPLVAAGLALAWWRGWLPRRTWLIAAGLQLVLVGGAIAAQRTGEDEEEVVERAVAESAIEAHEEAAEIFSWAAGGALVLFVAAAAIPRETIAVAVAGAAVVGSLAVLGLGYRVGHSGGELVYVHDAPAAYRGVGRVPARGGEVDDD